MAWRLRRVRLISGQMRVVLSAEVLTDKAWEWVSNDSWLTSQVTNPQSGSQTFAFNASENVSGLARIGTITLTTVEGDLTATITVNQTSSKDTDRDGLTDDEEKNPYFVIEGNFSWEQARLDAIRRGGTLAVIGDAAEHDSMTGVLASFSNSLWIGGSSEVIIPGVPLTSINFEWTTPTAAQSWIDASPLFNETFADDRWDDGQPSVLFGEVGIALQPGRVLAPPLDPLVPDKVEYLWVDLNKETILNGYVLELKKTNEFNPQDVTNDSRYKDGELWKDSDGDGLLGITEYELGTDPRTFDTDRDGLSDGEEFNPFDVVAGAFSWEDARDDAETRAGRLAVIESEDVLVRVMSALGANLEADLWIGGSNLAGIPYDAFNWLTDPATPVVYANWVEYPSYGFFGATAIKLQTDFEWDVANILEARAYLLERDSTNALNADSDDDGLTDGLEVKTYGTDPNNEDTDGDGLFDGPEIDAGTDPFDTDSDDDGRTDGEEVNGPIFTNPRNADSDGDGINDFDEVSSVPPSDPNDPNDPVDGGGGDGSDATGDPKRVSDFQTKNLIPLSTDVVKASDVFTPFGNSVQVVKYGDDGSQVVIDNSGVLLWGRSTNDGFKYLPIEGSEQAVALDVSNAELITWSNRYADFETYPDRPDVEVRIYRVDGSGTLNFDAVNVEGKEVLDTPSITTTSGSRIITTTERLQGVRDSGPPLSGIEDDAYFDALALRVYRITLTGEVQRIASLGDGDIPWNGLEWETTQEGPGVEALAYGSDGSQVYQYKDFLPEVFRSVTPVRTDSFDFFFFGNGDEAQAVYYDRVIWVNGFGEGEELVLDRVNVNDPAVTIERVISTSASRLVAEVNVQIREDIFNEFGERLGYRVVDVVREIRDYRRSNDGRGQISSPSTISLTNANERLLDAGNLTIRGNVNFIYTTDGEAVRSYVLNPSGLSLVGEIDLQVGFSDVSKINPLDGSAIIQSADPSTPLIWLFPTAEEPTDEALRFITVDSSEKAAALFVTSDELIVWDNAFEAIPFGTGVPNDVVIKHIVRSDPDPDGGSPNFLDVEVTRLTAEGIYVLNSPRAVLPNELWKFVTAEKLPDPGDTALLRTYQLSNSPNLDTDGDGILDRFETNTGTFIDNEHTGTDPEVADTDGDGLTDGEEVYPYYITRGSYTYSDAVIDAQKMSADGVIYRHLAVINSQRESNELKRRLVNTINADFWIGLNDLDVEGDFQWVDTTPPESFDFSNWALGQPNNLNQADAVVITNDYVWKTQPVSTNYGYILEVFATDPLNPDSDGDGLNDGAEFIIGTNPDSADTDGDTLTDGQEVNTYGSNPLIEDTDGDGLSDGDEVTIYGTDPTNPDTDGDGINDGEEVANGSDPLDRNDPNPSVNTDDSNPDHYSSEFLLEQDVSIPQSFTPFGSTLTVAKYGDDGSSVIADLSGVIVWTDSDGVFRRLPDSQFAAPLYVTNNEVIIWQNRFGDYGNYDTRPDVELILYRLDADGEILATPLGTVEGREVIDTPRLTTSTGSFLIATKERTEGPRERDGANVIVDFYDNATIRFYRVTFAGGVQRIATLRDKIPYESEEYSETQTGPDTKALGYGSDGSMFLKYSTTDGKGGFEFDENSLVIIEPVIEDKYVWINSFGSEQVVPLDNVNRAVSVTNARLVVEEAADNSLLDFRRIGIGQEITEPVNIGIQGSLVQGSVLNAINVTRVGLDNYFYAIEGTTIRTYLLQSSSADLIRTSILPDPLSSGAIVGPINARDGSAIIADENQDCLLWLHDNLKVVGSEGGEEQETGTFTRLKYSKNARALYVTNNECVIWENATAPIPEGGSPAPARVVHHTQDPDDEGGVDGPDDLAPYQGNAEDCDGTYRTVIYDITGTYVIDAPPFTPNFDNWFVITADKVTTETAKLRIYRLRSASRLDTDNDGIRDLDEIEIYGTDPEVADTDGDGLSDGEEVYPYYLIDDKLSYTSALIAANKTSASGNIYGHLAVINSLQELNLLIQRFGPSIVGNYWIGLDDLSVEGDFQWVDTTPPENFDFENWAPGQPNNLNQADGVIISGDYTWRTQPTETPYGYILELQETDPLVADSDDDGLSDSDEVISTLTDPNNADTDGDSGGVISYVVAGNPLGTYTLTPTDLNDQNDPDPLDDTNPKITDQDGDGLSDAIEIFITNTLPGQSRLGW